MIKKIEKLSGHYIVCGAGETGIHIIAELAKTDKPFVVIDHNQERLEKLAAQIPSLLYLKGDATEDEMLLAAGVERARGVMAALPSDKDNLYITVMAKQYNAPARVVALSLEDKSISKLRKAGAEGQIETRSPPPNDSAAVRRHETRWRTSCSCSSRPGPSPIS